jgi:hypothetical protein
MQADEEFALVVGNPPVYTPSSPSAAVDALLLMHTQCVVLGGEWGTSVAHVACAWLVGLPLGDDSSQITTVFLLVSAPTPVGHP